MTSVDEHIAAIESAIASRTVQIRELTQLELEQPDAKAEIISMRRKQRSEYSRENVHDKDLLAVLKDPAYASHVAKSEAAAREAFAAKQESAHDAILELDSLAPLYQEVDRAAAPFLESLVALRKSLASNVEPLVHGALKGQAITTHVRYEDAVGIYIDRVRAHDWHCDYALSRIVKSALDVLGLNSEYVKLSDLPWTTERNPGTFSSAHSHALATITNVFQPILTATLADQSRAVTPGWEVAKGPVKGSLDEKYQAQLALAQMVTPGSDPKIEAEALQRRLETDPEFVRRTQEMLAKMVVEKHL